MFCAFLNPYSSHRTKDQLPNTYKITGYIILYFTFTFSDRRWKDGKCRSE
jgi:hypothetical protein